MKRNLFLVSMIALFLCFFSIPTSMAKADTRNIADMENLLSSEEEEKLNTKIQELESKYHVSIVLVTTGSFNGKTATEYADDYYDQHNYGYGEKKDGILFLVSNANRKWAISTSGSGIKIFNKEAQSYMKQVFRPYLSKKQYEKAFDSYINLCGEYLNAHENGIPYRKISKSRWFSPGKILIGYLIGAVIGAIVVGIWVYKLRSVRFQPSANSYEKRDSLEITSRKDLFLYLSLIHI